MSIIGIIAFLLILALIVVVHELGHLIVAKRNGIYCHEFSIGMGPKVVTLGKDKSGTVYNIRAIPLGGFVQIAGEDTGLEEDENLPTDEKFDGKSKWIRFKVLVAGALMNFVLAALLLLVVGFFGGVESNDNTIEVAQGMPIASTSIQSGDEITSVNGVSTATYNEVVEQVTKSGKDIEMTYIHDGEQEKTQTVTKNADGKIGISATKEKYKIFQSIKYTIIMFIGIIGSVLYSIYMLITPQASIADLSGPLGIAFVSNGVVSIGIFATLKWIAFLSLNIGFVNLLPIPALDGGRILFIIIEAIRKKPINKDLEAKINNVIFFLLLALIIYVTFQDILRVDELKNLFN